METHICSFNVREWSTVAIPSNKYFAQNPIGYRAGPSLFIQKRQLVENRFPKIVYSNVKRIKKPRDVEFRDFITEQSDRIITECIITELGLLHRFWSTSYRLSLKIPRLCMKQCTIRTIQSIHEVQIQVSLRVSFAYINMHVAEAITLYPCYHVYGNRLEEFTKKIYYPAIFYSARYQWKLFSTKD